MTSELSLPPTAYRSAPRTRAAWEHPEALPEAAGSGAGSGPPEGAEGRDPSPADDGVELFRCAVWAGDEAAYERLVARYKRAVLCWIRRLPAADAVPGDDEDRAMRTFERFRLALRERRHEHFANAAALLGYLKLCAASVVLDDARRRWSRGAETLSLDAFSEAARDRAGVLGEERDTEARVMARVERGELWATVQQVLRNEAERRVVYLRFAIGLTPQQIHERHPDRYPTVDDVYRVKRNALLRLRRCRQLRQIRELMG